MLKKRYKLIAISVILAILAIGTYQWYNKNTVKRISATEVKLGTVVKVDVWATDDQVIQALFNRLDDLEKKMSLNIPESELNRLNEIGWKEPVALSTDTTNVLGTALRYAELSEGWFDPTIGPLSKLWGIGTDHAAIPAKEKLDAAISHVGYAKVHLNGTSARLDQQGMIIDLGGIAKGYAADELMEVLDEYGIEQAILNLGGNVFVKGSNPDGRLWSIGLQNPFDTQGKYFGIAKISDLTVVSSGNYERFFTDSEGKRYHHILNPFDGFPIDNDVAMVTIIGGSSMEADALSTTLFALGPDKGIKLIEEKTKGFEAIIVTKDKHVHLTSGAEAYFELTDNTFTVQERP